MNEGALGGRSQRIQVIAGAWGWFRATPKPPWSGIQKAANLAGNRIICSVRTRGADRYDPSILGLRDGALMNDGRKYG